MDPVTAFGLAGAVVQFLEFSSKLVKGAVEVYHSTSGVTAELRDLDITTNDLKALTQRLRVPAPNGHLSPGDQNLIVLKEECGRLSDELLAAIQATTAKTSGSKLASLRASYKAVTTKKKLASLSARLDRYRTQVIGIVLGMLNDDFSSTKLLLESSIQEHAKGSRATRDEIRQARDTLTATIQSEIRRSQNTGEPTATQDILTAIHQSLMKIDTALHTVGREDKILHRLWFSHLGSRERTVENAHKNTYRWLLYDSHIKTPASDDILLRWEAKLHVQKRTCFLEWLRAKSGIFYISGKAGSGKSTLMKFVAHEDRTRQELEGWAQASGKTLILARFFFWISGNSLERSLEGLYRSILWDILRQCPSMIPIVFPTAWSSNIDITSMPPNSERPFDMTELQAAINQLFGNKKTMFNYKVCCFIDGLDEYEGDYWAFAKNLSSWASASENIKFCLSSRPHEEFRRHFASDPLTHMKLHELTRGDMYLFVESQFDQDERFEAFRDEDNQGSQHFIESIIKKSEGVFLWVRLVTFNLLKGMGDCCSMVQLCEKLDSVPQGMRSMLQQMMQSIEKSERKRAARTFLTMSEDGSFWGVSGWPHTQAILDDLLDNPGLQTRLLFGDLGATLSPEESTRKCHAVCVRVIARCKGLIEVVPVKGEPFPHCHHLQFVHRSVKDFFSDPDIQDELRKAAGEDFCPFAAFNLVLLAHIKFGNAEPAFMMDALLHTCSHAAMAGLPPFSRELVSAIRMLKQLAECDAENSVRLLLTSLEPELQTGMNFCKVEREHLEAAIIHDISFRGIKYLAVDFVSRNPSLLLPASHGGYDIVLAAALCDLSSAVQGEQETNLLPALAAQVTIDPNTESPGACKLYYANGYWESKVFWRWTRDPPWTTWTSFLLAVSQLMRYRGGEERDLRIVSKIIELFLHLGAEPSVCFVGYRMIAASGKAAAKAEEPFYLDLLGVMQLAHIIPTAPAIEMVRAAERNHRPAWAAQRPGPLAKQLRSPQAREIRLLPIDDLSDEPFRVVKVLPFEALGLFCTEELGELLTFS